MKDMKIMKFGTKRIPDRIKMIESAPSSFFELRRGKPAYHQNLAARGFKEESLVIGH